MTGGSRITRAWLCVPILLASCSAGSGADAGAKADTPGESRSSVDTNPVETVGDSSPDSTWVPPAPEDLVQWVDPLIGTAGSGNGMPGPLVPHGMAVVLNAPAAFRFTAPACPERHLHAAEALGADVSGAKPEDAGRILSEWVIEIMKQLDIPNGLGAIGYSRDDIPKLVEGTLPQHRVIKLSPRPAGPEELTRIFEDAMVYW